MPAMSGKLARIRYTAAVATSSTNQACTLSSADKVTLTITATGRRRFDPTSTNANLRVFGTSTSVPYAAAKYNVQHGKGSITFTTPRSTAVTYTMDVPWLATSFLTLAKSWGLTVNQDMLDVTSFATASSGAATPQWRTFVPGLTDASVSVSRFFNSSSTGPVILDRKLLDSPFYLELIADSTDQGGFVCYGRVETDQFSVDIGSIVAEEVTFKPTGPVYFTT